MKTRTEWIVAALLVGACGGTERIEGRAATIEPEKALIASAKQAEAEAQPSVEKPAARAPAELDPTRDRPMLRSMPHWPKEPQLHREGDW